ncbi:MAG: glutamine--fructose-6-phosphate transaminase (isomerizing) [Fimbriimonas ginsengisoli]|uniref:Glutamine--fructose-6-phosphate aminotransferase [isomerizing] n=1 Tax=Fimbriimonas ginsengisoli TaxID=1005039 RepID=A0A931PUF4_FIMGI|nr:glutamine--fructose-6-phosphate transaminase (isomerizing) [Fimbriimonas ginsengisoli]
MCGIAGYVGPKNAVDVVFDQLKRLEYRGYDSAGIAFRDNGNIAVVKRAGKLSELGKALHDMPSDTHLAIAHSRWATHGAPTDLNAHPHYDAYEQVAMIHNGIIENYLDLRDELVAKGHLFQSQTDTEVAAHVIGEEYAPGVPLEEAVRRAVKRLRGAFALVVISKREDGKIVAVRNASPIVIGLGKGENLLASDIPALLPYTRDVVVLEEGHLAVLTPEGVRVLDEDGRDLPLRTERIDWDVAMAERGGYEHFMLKEIHEQPAVIRQSLAGRIDENGQVRLERVFSEHVWTEIDRVNLIACGTAYHAALMGKFLFERLLRLPTDVYYSSEFRYGDPVLSPRSLAIFVSQSGETADTLAALRLCKARRIRTLGIVNVVGSSIARECDRTIFTQAGPEISVASTKAYTAQVMVLTLLALYIAQVNEAAGIRVDDWIGELMQLPEKAKRVLKTEPQIVEVCRKIQDAPLCFFLGRGADAYTALEGALKFKEICYVPTQESPAGEMKHGPLALVVPGVVAIFGATDPATADKVVSNMKEVQARGGTVVAITTDEDTVVHKAADHVLQVPHSKHEFLTALLSVIPLQLIAYHVARIRGCEIDQPRNLAKSVTVE